MRVVVQLLLNHPKLCPCAARASFRCVSSRATSATQRTRADAHIVDFEVSGQQAVEAFKRYQQQRCHRLQASDVLQKDAQPLPLFLPFWLFTANVSAECKATLGYRADKSNTKSAVSWSPMAEWKAFCHRTTLPCHEPYMQVYASYQHRRDLAQAARLGQQQLAAARRLTPQEKEAAAATGWQRRNTGGGSQAAGRAFTIAGTSSSSSTASSTTASSSTASRSSSSTATDGSSGTSATTTAGHDSTTTSRPGGNSSTSSNGSHNSRDTADASSSNCSTSASLGSDSSSSRGTGSQGSDSSSSGTEHQRSSLGGQASGLVFDPADMRRPLAWALCYRALKHRLIEDAVAWLKQSLNADEVKDLQVTVRVHHRTSSLVYAPAYWLQYTYGVQHTPGRGDIVPEHFEMLVAGSGAVTVAAELHPSPAKAQAASAGAVGAVGLAALPAVEVAFGLEPTSLSMGLVDGAFFAFLAAAAGGVLARALPRLARNQHMAAQAAREKEFYQQYDHRESAPQEPPDAHTLWLWLDQDWRRWEGEAPWDWQPGERAQWAEDLWRQQVARLRERERFQERQRQQKEQREADEATEEARSRKWGRSRAWSSHGHGEGGTGHAHHHAGHSGRRRRRDFLGYYKIIGVDPEGEVSEEVIKVAFKKAALQLHPDTQAGADAAALQQSADKFRRLQTAYEVLRDPKRRQSYDAGRLMQ